MRRFLAIAAACAALVACTKEQGIDNGSSFKKGQVVTLNVTADMPATKVTSELNTTTGAVDFKWQAGDKIKVIVGTESAEFTLASGAGDASATFTGTMPADGSTFSVQYPVTDPTLTAQTYSSTEAIPHDMMKFAASGCTTSSPTFSLTPQNAALRLNLWGTSQTTISKIVVTNKSTSDAYTFNISGGATLSTDSSNPTPFFIVVPAGDWNFSAEVISADMGSSLATPPTDAIQNGVFTVGATNVFTTSSAKTFTAGQILNMDAKQVSYTKVYFSKGNLYYDGSFKFEDTQYAYTSAYDANHVCRFRWAANSGTLSDDITSALSTSTDELQGTTSDVFFTNATQTTPRAEFVVNGASNTWRTLSGKTSGEWKYLLSTRRVNGGTGEGKSYQRATINSDGTSVYGMIIYPDNYTSQTGATSYTSYDWTTMETAGCVFLPAAGYRGSSMTTVGSRGYYWSSTPGSSSAYSLYFHSGGVGAAINHYREEGLSVRLVSVAQ